MSDWNLFLERRLSLDLTRDEYRLSDALARNLLGFRTRSERLGDTLLRGTSRLHGRSFERARAGLVEKGFLHYEPGRPGRGYRSLYELLLGDEEMPAEARDFRASERTASNSAEKPAPQRARRGERGKDDYVGVADSGEPPPQPFASLTRRLGPLSASQRSEWLGAWHESPEGFEWLVRNARGDRPAAIVTRQVRDGEHLVRAQSRLRAARRFADLIGAKYATTEEFAAELDARFPDIKEEEREALKNEVARRRCAHFREPISTTTRRS